MQTKECKQIEQEIQNDSIRRQEVLNEEFKYLFRFPKKFNFKASENVKRFLDRLEEIRIKRLADSKRIDELDDDYNYYDKEALAMNSWTLEEVAHEMHITSAGMTKYHKKLITTIPEHQIRNLCKYFCVTPHYLLGLVDDEFSMLSMDEFGNVEYDENNQPKVLKLPMISIPDDFYESFQAYKKLYYENPQLYFLISDLIHLKCRDKYIPILKELLKI